MKMKKVLAAVLAGTMVMAGTMTAFASEPLTSAEWWSGTGYIIKNSSSSDDSSSTVNTKEGESNFIRAKMTPLLQKRGLS